MASEAEGFERRLAAIMAADVVGFSALVGDNEESALKAVKALWQNIVEPTSRNAGGRVVKTMGDGVLVEFPSAVKAVQCAMNIQEATASGDTAFPDGVSLVLRIGLHVGDIVIDGSDILGDGVNLAARLEALAEPGGLCISAALRDQLTRDLAALFTDSGSHQLKNIDRPVRVFMLGASTGESPDGSQSTPGGGKPKVALGAFTARGPSEDAQLLSEGAQQTTAAFLSGLTGIQIVSPNAGPDYLADATIQTVGNRFRCMLRLVETAQETPVLNQRFDGSMDDVFDAQDTLASQISTALRYSVLEHHASQIGLDADGAFDPEQALAKAGQILMGPPSDGWPQASELIDRYLEERPDDFMGLAMKATVVLEDVICNVRAASAERGEEARRLLARAHDLKPDSDFVTLIRSSLHIFVDHDLAAGMRALERALDLTPGYVLAINSRALGLTMQGDFEAALEAFDQVVPAFTKHRFLHRAICCRSLCLLAMGDYAEAVEATQRSLESAPNYPQALGFLAWAAMASGQQDLGRNAMAALLTVTPDLSEDTLLRFPFVDETISASMRDNLLAAGLPPAR